MSYKCHEREEERREGKGKESGEEKIKCPVRDRDVLYVSDLTSGASNASCRDFPAAPIF